MSKRLLSKKALVWLFVCWITAFTAGTIIWTTFRNQTEKPPAAVETPTPVPEPVLFNYIEIIDGCLPTIDATCVTAHSGPSASSSVRAQLREGTVLKVAETVLGSASSTWHRIVFDEWLRYPNRVSGEWYVSAEHARLFQDAGAQELATSTAPNTKRIVVDLSEQKLYAYEGDMLFMEQTVSTGLAKTPTPRGTFEIFRKTPSRYMQGPIPGISGQHFDLPGVPWDLYFTEQGGAIHGTYWHESFGQRWSSGCVNMPPAEARRLYEWADLGTPVTVHD